MLRSIAAARSGPPRIRSLRAPNACRRLADPPRTSARTTGRRPASISTARCRGCASAASGRSFARTCSGGVVRRCASEKRTGSALTDASARDVGLVEERQRSAWRLPPRRAHAAGTTARRRAGCRRPQVMIEKAERPIGGERRQPQRQSRELNGHRIEIDAEQASLGDRPPDRGAFRRTEVAG